MIGGAGIQTTPGVKNDILDRYVLATGTDGYRVVYSLGELGPAFGNRADLVATQETIAGKTAPLTGDGLARTTAPGDVKGGRYVANLVNLQVFAAAPVPESAKAAMLLAGLAGLRALARVTRRTDQ